ncbi:MAG: BlaI/MecI/CopY family transcriptional regulator [Sedimentisphaerales bacterium]|nr:BlaI/MecI/CopY family transcriptional regulator [Sedimentisphaerales bacterium]
MRLTDAEWHVMNCLWEKHPATARGIAGRLPAEVKWAYTTIRTLLARLVGKGAVHEYKEGNTSLYEPILSRENARRSALKTLVNQAFDGAYGPLMHFLVNDHSLTARQRQVLSEALQEQPNRRGGQRNGRDNQ